MMPWAVLGLFVLFLIISYIIVQGTRAALAWRQAAEQGDVEVIHDIVEESLKHWGSQKRPKNIAPEVWRGIQSLQLTSVAPEFVQVSCVAESEYTMQDGRWIEIRNPLHEGFAVTARAADMIFYELGHYRPEIIQIDVYTTYRNEAGVTKRECVLSTQATREQAREVDWEEWPAEDIVRAFDTYYRLGETGRPLPIQPLIPPVQPEEADAEVTKPAEAHS